MDLSKSIINWYLKNKRELPWRNTSDPYLIWLSEVILQQTRVEQGLPYYLKFTQKYKTVKQLANANDDDVMKLWQGLGYYNRAANMLKTARIVKGEFNGEFPTTYEELIKLKGIGSYTAAAVSSFSRNERRAVLDGNVFRVLSRLFSISDPINSVSGKKIFEKIADELLDKKNPALYNQGIMELGALICKPRSPLCTDCPVRIHCSAFKEITIEKFPVKIKKNKPRDRYLSYFFIDDNKYTYITQRTEKSIWKGLFELPNIESAEKSDPERILSGKEFGALFLKKSTLTLERVYSAKHQLTHQTIYADFFKISSKKPVKPNGNGYIRVKLKDLKLYAVPRLFDKFLNYLKLHANE